VGIRRTLSNHNCHDQEGSRKGCRESDVRIQVRDPECQKSRSLQLDASRCQSLKTSGLVPFNGCKDCCKMRRTTARLHHDLVELCGEPCGDAVGLKLKRSLLNQDSSQNDVIILRACPHCASEAVAESYSVRSLLMKEFREMRAELTLVCTLAHARRDVSGTSTPIQLLGSTILGSILLLLLLLFQTYNCELVWLSVSAARERWMAWMCSERDTADSNVLINRSSASAHKLDRATITVSKSMFVARLSPQ